MRIQTLQTNVFYRRAWFIFYKCYATTRELLAPQIQLRFDSIKNDQFYCKYTYCDNLDLFPFITIHRMFDKSNTTATTSRTITELITLPEYLSSPDVLIVLLNHTFCVVFCRSFFVLFVLFRLTVVLSVLRVMAPEHSFGIFKLF